MIFVILLPMATYCPYSAGLTLGTFYIKLLLATIKDQEFIKFYYENKKKYYQSFSFKRNLCCPAGFMRKKR